MSPSPSPVAAPACPTAPVASPGRRGPDPAVRLAGLPLRDLTLLRTPRTAAAVDAVLAARRALAERAERLSADLHAEIGRLTGDPARAAVVGLRRSVRHGRPPTDHDWDDGVRRLPATLAASLSAWADLLDACRATEAGLPALLDSEMPVLLDRLLAVCADPGFRWALGRSSPALAAELDKWAADPRRRPRQQTVLRLCRYVARAAAKTSPYSLFTVSGIGRWDATGSALRLLPTEPPRLVPELDGRWLQVVTRALARHPALDGAARLRPNPSLDRGPDGDSVELVGPPPAESLVRLPLSPAVAACLEAVRPAADGAAPSRRAVRSALAERTGHPVGAVDAFLDRLVDAGVVEQYLPVADHAPDAVDRLVALLAGAGPPARSLHRAAAALSGALTGPGGGSMDAPRAGADPRPGHAALQRAAAELAAQSGAGPHAPAPVEVHEAAVLPGPPGACDPDVWAPVLRDLDVTRRWLALFDSKLPLRLVLGEWVAARYGPGAVVPFLALHRAVQAEIAAPAGRPGAADLRAVAGSAAGLFTPSIGGCTSARLHELDALRARTRAAALDGGEGGCRHLDPARLAAEVDARPAWATDPGPATCYVQPLTGPGPLRVVLNVVHGGHGRGRGRLAQHLAGAGGPAPAGPRDGGGPAVAELGGLLGSTLNVRAPVAPFEIDYPFAVSARPARERIPLTDLVAVHDPATGLVGLRSRRLDRPVAPVHLGMQAEFQLPPAARFLERGFASAYLAHPGTPPLLADLAYRRGGGVTARPRVEVGRVVVQRARWLLPATAVPRPGGAVDAAYLLRLTAWFDEQGLPRRGFVRFWGERGRGDAAKARKPGYLDTASWPLVALFARELAHADLVLVDEALPDPAPPDRGPAPDRVVELVLEVGGRRG